MHLGKAPIVEALVDLRVQAKAGTGLGQIETFAGKVRDRYPTVKPIHQVIAHFQVQPLPPDQPQQSVSQTQTGYRLESADGKHVLQAGTNSFTLSRLAPYEDWDALLAETREMWDIYATVAAPEIVERVAVRYINRIELPLPILDFGKYLTAPPAVPKGLPDSVSEYFSRVVINDPRSNAAIIFSQAFEPIDPARNHVLPVIIDIDVFKQGLFTLRGNDHWELLSEFRALKNTAFFASLTDDTLELLK